MSVRTCRPVIRQMKVVPFLTHHKTLLQAEVKSTSGKTYYVSIPEKVNPVNNGNVTYYEYKVTCHCKNDPTQLPACPGNSRHTVCKHGMAFLEARLNMVGVKLAICDKSENGSAYDNAVRRTRLGGCLIKLMSSQGNGVIWAVGQRK